MSDDESTDTVTAEVPTTLKDEFEEEVDWGQRSDKIEELLREFVSGGSLPEKERLQKRREDLLDDIEGLQAEKNTIDQQIQKKEKKLERVRESLEDLRANQTQYEKKLTQAEGVLYNGTRVTEAHPLVKDAADLKGCTTASVLDDLKDRNPGVPDYAWQLRSPNFGEGKEWNGISEDVARGDG